MAIHFTKEEFEERKSKVITKLKEQKDFEFLDSEAKMMTNRRKMDFSDYGRA